MRRDLEHFARHRPLHRPSQPKQHWGFSSTRKTIDNSPGCRYSSDQKKRCLNFLYEGLPWRQPDTPDEKLGYGDLIFIDTGLHYAIACDFIHETDDSETLITLWSELRDDILREHVKRRPGTRPWAWWREDTEERRVVKIDKKMLACNGGRIFESEEEYLARHDLSCCLAKKQPKKNSEP